MCNIKSVHVSVIDETFMASINSKLAKASQYTIDIKLKSFNVFGSTDCMITESSALKIVA